MLVCERCLTDAWNGGPQRHLWTPERAVAFIKEARSHILLGPKQWSALHEFARQQQQGGTLGSGAQSAS